MQDLVNEANSTSDAASWSGNDVRAYIEARCIGGEWAADVITSQDYHERGPFARTYRTRLRHQDAAGAIREAIRWATANELRIVDVHDI